MNGGIDYECSFIYSTTFGNKVTMSNSTLENILIQLNKPLFAVYKTIFE